ncbi:MAG: hypothetical protein ACW99G_05105 [Candidatus Thorarchaeota archaeon]|jgi:hypothetical protein
MIMGGILYAIGIGVIFLCGGLHATNRIQRNMMDDLVEAEDMARWLRVWS